MIRTAIFASLAVLGFATAGSAHPPQPIYYPQVQPGRSVYYPPTPVETRPRVRFYEVEFRRWRGERWVTFLVTPNHQQAHDVARNLRRQGFDARVDH